MSALTCGQVRDLAPELALGVLTGAERAEAVAHVNECARCRSLLTDLSGVADALTLLVPEAEPPRGFERNVLGAMSGERSRWARFRRVGALAVTAAAACIVTLVLVRVVDSARDSDPEASAPVNADVQTAPMVGAGDEVVGQAFVTDGDHPWAYLFVQYGVMPSGTYAVRVKTAGGSDRSEMQVTDGEGYWAGVVPAPDDVRIALVAPDGNVVCKGALA
jgi:Putative zinc-finger